MRNFKAQWLKLTKEHQVLGLMLLLGLLIGLTFIYVVPPWQHYDEPTQFEYAWLIGNRPGLPASGDFDQSMRREVAASMIEHDFFRDLGFKPNLLSISKPIWIGITQAGSKPLYYWLASLPIRIIQAADTTFQLYVLRFTSLLLYLATIIAAYGIAVELTPQKHPLRWLLPLSILILPSFVDIMTAVNDDVGATAFFSFFLWAGIRMIYRGFNWLRLVVLLLLGVVCFFTKTTVMVAVFLVLIPVLYSLIRGKRRRYVWFAMAGMALIILSSLITWRDAAYWYKAVPQVLSTRAIDTRAPLGDNVFRLSLSPETSTPEIVQIVHLDEVSKNEIASYTLGAWIWADQPMKVRTPLLQANDEDHFREVEVGKEPKFYSLTEEINPTNSPFKVILSPVKMQVGNSATVYYDGVVLLEGAWPENSTPIFSADSGEQGQWGGEDFTNLLRNPSAESAWPRIRRWVESVITERFPGNPSLVLGLLLDPGQVKYYYVSTFKLLSQSFWARFGWAHVILQGYHPYTMLGLITLAGCIGALFAAWRNKKNIRWDVVFFLGVSLIVVWGSTFLRGLTSTLDGPVFIPVARYAYPVIIPTMLIFNIGWLEIIGWFERNLKIPTKVLFGLLIGFFVLLDVLSIYSIYQFYNG